MRCRIADTIPQTIKRKPTHTHTHISTSARTHPRTVFRFNQNVEKEEGERRLWTTAVVISWIVYDVKGQQFDRFVTNIKYSNSNSYSTSKNCLDSFQHWTTNLVRWQLEILVCFFFHFRFYFSCSFVRLKKKKKSTKTRKVFWFIVSIRPESNSTSISFVVRPDFRFFFFLRSFIFGSAYHVIPDSYVPSLYRCVRLYVDVATDTLSHKRQTCFFLFNFYFCLFFRHKNCRWVSGSSILSNYYSIGRYGIR